MDESDKILKGLLEEVKFHNDINECFQCILGYGLIEKVKTQRPDLLEATKKKILSELKKTDLYKKYIHKLSKEN